MTEIEKEVRRIVADWAGLHPDELKLNDWLGIDLSLDDLDREMIREEIEDVFGIKLDGTAATVADLCRDVERQRPLLNGQEAGLAKPQRRKEK
jgi:acyl carrier protein